LPERNTTVQLLILSPTLNATLHSVQTDWRTDDIMTPVAYQTCLGIDTVLDNNAIFQTQVY